MVSKAHSILSDFLSVEFLRSRARKWKRRRSAEGRKTRKAGLLRQHGAFDDTRLAATLSELGISEGSILFVQSSFNDLLTYSGSPGDLINCLQETVGPSGTLLMPAYTDPRANSQNVIDMATEPTYTGIVNEIFRRSEGVVRSAHPRHSICGRGPLAQQLLENHHSAQFADGVDSPFDRMRKYAQARIVTLGLPKCYVSFLHWVEDFEPEMLPFSIHSSEPEFRSVRMQNGNVVTVQDHLVDRSACRLTLSNTCRRLSGDAMRSANLHGIELHTYGMRNLARELLVLRDSGTIHYERKARWNR